MGIEEFWWHPDAEAEFVASFQWYYDRNPDAADAFEIELDSALNLIAKNPGTWPQYLHQTQKFVLRHYPFNLVFRNSSERIEIIAVAHQRRKPGYWKDRLK